MGVKTIITLRELQDHFPCTMITPTIHGLSDTVYHSDAGVVKRFENASSTAILEERNLLISLSSLPIAKQKGEIFYLQNKPSVLYETLGGESLQYAKEEHIIQIACFMRDFHTLSRGKISHNIELFKPAYLQILIEKSNSIELMEIFETIDLVWKNDGIIHGDLFLDNALFENEKLSGVIDFIEACEGDFLFDLAVVAISWCLEEQYDHYKIDLLLTHYNAGVSFQDFIPYMRYALLYYATTRYLNHRDYQSLLAKIPLLETLDKGYV